MNNQITTNPFATKYTRAGRIPFRFAEADSLQTLRRRFAAADWWGQIVGPHGSGKTSLLHLLDQHWRSWGRSPHAFVLRNGQRRISPLPWQAWLPHDQVIVDGFEQLSLLAKLLLVWRCKRKRVGLLVTTHRRSLFFPVIQECKVTHELACDLVACLTQDHPCVSRETVMRCCDACGMNLRESFMMLYDEYATAQVEYGATNRQTD